MARASGVRRDIRKDEPYLCFADNWDGQGAPAVDFKVPVMTTGDVYARYLVRLEEMKQSLTIIRQLIDNIPAGPGQCQPRRQGSAAAQGSGLQQHRRVDPAFRIDHDQPRLRPPPRAKSITASKAATANWATTSSRAGENVPWRVRTRPPCYINYQVFPEADRRPHDQRRCRGARKHQRHRGGIGSMSDENGEDAEHNETGPRFVEDAAHAHRCHIRWIKSQTRGSGKPYKDDWYSQQCGGCRFYIRLQGKLRADWGAYSNARSPRDGIATFEHDGCDAFVADAEGWT